MGVRYHQFAFPKGTQLTGRLAEGLDDREAKAFMELLIPEGAEVLAYYDHYAWKEYAAVTKCRFGKGNSYYIGCMTDTELLGRILADALEAAEVSREVKEQFPVIVRKGVNGLGRRLWYYLNYSAEEQTAAYAGKEGRDILTGELIDSRQEIRICPWDLRIIEEVS